MFKPIHIIGIVVFFILGLFSFGFSQESMTITTYYPSPYGSYNELRANQASIGSGYSSASLINGVLLVESKVGIGMVNPGAELDVNGTIQAIRYNASDGTAGATGTQVIVTNVTQNPATKDITVTTKTITYKNGLITGIN